MRISLSSAWDETRAVLARDGRLLVAVALALLVLPGIVTDLSMPETAAGEMPPVGPWLAIGAVAVALSMAGQLALIRLALGAGTTVGEAIAHGFRRLPQYFAAVLLWVLPLVLLALGLYSATGIGTDAPRAAPALGFLLIVFAGVYLAIRLVLSSPVASAEAIGPVAILKRSWALGRGNWWRLFGFALLFFITLLVLLTATQAVFGSVVAAAAGGLKPWSLGALLVSLISQLVSAAASIVFFVMLAQLYRQAAGATDGPSVPNSGT